MQNKIYLLIIIAVICGICLVGYSGYYFIVSQGEGVPYFKFTEVPANEIGNSSVIHLEDLNTTRVKGFDIRRDNGKISRIYVRSSQMLPGDGFREFHEKISSYPGNQSLKKILEYEGVDNSAVWVVP